MPKKEYLDFDFDDITFRAIAIHTALPPAIMAWQIDRIMGTKFSLLPFTFGFVVKKVSSEHTQYYFREEEFDTEWWLLENTGTQNSLLNVKPQPDMLLIGRGGEDETAGADWTEKLKSIPGMTLVYDINDKEKKKLTWVSYLADRKSNEKEEER